MSPNSTEQLPPNPETQIKTRSTGLNPCPWSEGRWVTSRRQSNFIEAIFTSFWESLRVRKATKWRKDDDQIIKWLTKKLTQFCGNFKKFPQPFLWRHRGPKESSTSRLPPFRSWSVSCLLSLLPPLRSVDCTFVPSLQCHKKCLKEERDTT